MELTIDKALRKAVAAQKVGQMKEADRLYTAILKAQPKHPDANHNLGVLAVSIGKVNEALPFLKTALESNPSIAQFWLSFIDALIKLDRISDARAVLHQAKSKGPKDDGFVKLEKRLTKAGQAHLDADQIAEELQPELPNILSSLTLDQALKLAKKKKKDGVPEEAQHLYQDILLKFPKNKRAKDGLKRLDFDSDGNSTSKVQDPPKDQVQSLIDLFNQGQLQQALKQVETVVKQFPKSALLLNIQGVILKSLGQLDLSVDAYKKALVIKPDFADAYNNMGLTLQEKGELDEAIKAYKKALFTKPYRAEVYNNMGLTLKEQGELDEAIEAYKKALVIKPDFAEAYNNMGLTLQEQGELDESMEAYRKALVTKPDYARAIENSQSLAVQLLPIIDNYGYDFFTSEAQVNSEVMHRPMYLIQNAIKCFLEGDFGHAASYKDNFEAFDRERLGTLNPKDLVFCNAYSKFIGKLLDAKWDEENTAEHTLYHLGESHSLSYAHRIIAIGGSNFRIVPRITFGAKAFHFTLSKPNASKSITKAHLSSLPKNSKVFLSYGEIDCRPNEGFISAATKHEKPLEELIDQTAKGYVQWFLDQNADRRHRLYFINLPAPIYDKMHSDDLNSKVARTVALFNAALKKYTQQHGLDRIDVFKFTCGKEGFSNGLFHIDNYHLGAKALVEIQRQLA